MEKTKYTPCKYCGKKIHVDDWGGLAKDGFFHRKCYIDNKQISNKPSVK